MQITKTQKKIRIIQKSQKKNIFLINLDSRSSDPVPFSLFT